jgi:pSer/pThr/pTyr-binding forkhead associated (FHA) protein/flagellar motor switch/type III secretory pathway protein FliN
MDQTVGADAAAVLPSWEAALPRLNADDVARQRRWTPHVERLRELGPRLATALPGVLRRWWPFAAPEGRVQKLRVTDAEGGERTLDLDRFPLRIGRSEACPLQLPHPKVSTEHAELQLERGQLFLMDLRSTNGTRRNGEPVTPLTPVPLERGDAIDIGPFRLSVLGADEPEGAFRFAVQAGGARPLSAGAAFRLTEPSDRWVRVRWAGETCFVRLSAPWMRACWQRLSDVSPETGGDVHPMEEGAAQFVVYEIARALEEELEQPVELAGWLTTAEAQKAGAGEALWLEVEAKISTPNEPMLTTLLFPVPEPAPARWFDGWTDLAWAATVCLGLIRLSLADWRRVEVGDALLPDVWWPEGWTGESAPAKGDLGPAFLRLQRSWNGARLMRSEAGVKLRLDTLWLNTPGGDWLMAEEDSPGEAQSLAVKDLELQIAIELDRFPVTVGEIQRWRTGEVLPLRHGPADPVRLVVETGLQRRVLAEGRVVLLDGKLGVEILRILTTLEDGRGEPPA